MATTVSCQQRCSMRLLVVFVTLTFFTFGCDGDVYFKTQAINISLVTSSAPSNAGNAIDNNYGSIWTLPPGLAQAYLKANFMQQAVYAIRLVIPPSATAKPNSVSIRLLGVNSNWIVFVNKTCRDPFYHWINDTDLGQCVTYNASGDTTVVPLQGLFTVLNTTSGNPIWWEPFSQLTLTFDGLSSDFNNATAAFSIAELSVYGWPNWLSIKPTCNCDPTANGQMCNATSSVCDCPPLPSGLSATPSSTCRPVIQTLDPAFPAYFGPLSGGTAVLLNGTFGQGFVDARIGGRYDCRPYGYIYNDHMMCIATAVYSSDPYLNVPMPFYICFVDQTRALSCVITRDEFTYLPSDPVITSVSRESSFSYGGELLTITGTNFSSIHAFSVPDSLQHNSPFRWPLIYILDSFSYKLPVPYYDIYPANSLNGSSGWTQVNSCTISLSENTTGTSSLVCQTPAVLDSSAWKLQLDFGICLGTEMDSKGTPQQPSCSYQTSGFAVCEEPSGIGLVDTAIYGSNPVIRIQGNNFCCKQCVDGDYTVTVAGQPCVVTSVVMNFIVCQPPPCPWPNYSPSKGSEVVVSTAAVRH